MSHFSLLAYQTPAKPLPRHPQRELSRDAHQRHTQRHGGRDLRRHLACGRRPARIPRAKSNTGPRQFSSASAVAAGRDRHSTPATPPANCPGRARSPRCQRRSPRQRACGGPLSDERTGTIRKSHTRQGTMSQAAAMRGAGFRAERSGSRLDACGASRGSADSPIWFADSRHCAEFYVLARCVARIDAPCVGEHWKARWSWQCAACPTAFPRQFRVSTWTSLRTRSSQHTELTECCLD